MALAGANGADNRAIPGGGGGHDWGASPAWQGGLTVGELQKCRTVVSQRPRAGQELHGPCGGRVDELQPTGCLPNRLRVAVSVLSRRQATPSLRCRISHTKGSSRSRKLLPFSFQDSGWTHMARTGALSLSREAARSRPWGPLPSLAIQTARSLTPSGLGIGRPTRAPDSFLPRPKPHGPLPSPCSPHNRALFIDGMQTRGKPTTGPATRGRAPLLKTGAVLLPRCPLDEHTQLRGYTRDPSRGKAQ